MKKELFIIIGLLAGQTAYSQCYGTDSYKTCSDFSNGNNYTVRKFGNRTYVDGYNSNTGSHWSQQSSKFGSTTITNGTSANGNHWNSTTRSLGNGSYSINGTDSRGNNFSTYCFRGNCR